MERVTRALKILVRASGAGALLLGFIIWSGHARAWLPVHVAFGVTLVLALAATVVVALMASTRRGLAVFLLAWSVLVLVFGRLQVSLLPGPHHWMVSLAHLLIGGIAIGLGAALADAVQKRLEGRAS